MTVACRELQAVDRPVRAFDSLLHEQDGVVAGLIGDGIEVLEVDLLDPAARRAALTDVDVVVHLAAIVGDPACARDPETARSVNVDATRALLGDARAAGVRRLVFAPTCSNYGRLEAPSDPADEEPALCLVSLYAEQKVAIEQLFMSGDFAE